MCVYRKWFIHIGTVAMGFTRVRANTSQGAGKRIHIHNRLPGAGKRLLF